MVCNGKTKQHRQIRCSGVPECSSVPECSGVPVFWGVPVCSGVPGFSTCRHEVMPHTNMSLECLENSGRIPFAVLLVSQKILLSCDSQEMQVLEVFVPNDNSC